MLLFDKKRALNSILGAPDMDKKEVIDALQAIAEELVGAIHEKNIDGVKSSLRAAVAEIGSGSQTAEGPQSEG